MAISGVPRDTLEEVHPREAAFAFFRVTEALVEDAFYAAGCILIRVEVGTADYVDRFETPGGEVLEPITVPSRGARIVEEDAVIGRVEVAKKGGVVEE